MKRDRLKRERCGRLIVLSGMAAMAVAAAARGSAVPITYESQTRSVSASSSASGFPSGGTNPAPTTDQESQSQQANGTGDFSGNVAAESNIGPQNAEASASAIQQSSLDTTGFSDSGSITADSVFGIGGPASSASSSIFQITFDVAQAESYVFDANLTGATDPGDPDATTVDISLTKKSGKAVFGPITSVKLTDFVEQGTLKAGTYSFEFDTQATSGDENFDSVNYDISLTSAPLSVNGADGGTGTIGSSPVPLPSSGLTAMAMLSVLGVAGLLRRSLRVWARVSV